ncbi:hypothetical protein F5Y09DRAFT_340842 [Xylaria sp. FL1042]|nr:hypothetical protein F5Y09DRAFT_340842 [Xylaria sp. FL1042]
MVADQLSLFRGMTGVKKIVSIGSWSFSTDPGTYTIFRDAVCSETNRKTLEYPDEPDIPGIPAGSAADSNGYLFLLDELKNAMPSGKTVSITALASFWYLQYFPIQALSVVVDYIVYMTYDLHGQWDYTNKFASPGCPSYDQGLGNCLRSHVNQTETINALSMITKAVVPSNMIAVGVSSYGRPFKSHLLVAEVQNASDYEINLILKENPTTQEYWDEDSLSSIAVFNETEWVAYMNTSTKNTRKVLYPLLSFLRTADWAVDLESETGDGSESDTDSDSNSNPTIYIDPDIWNSPTLVVTAEPGAILIWPPKSLKNPSMINFPSWTHTTSYSSLTTHTRTDSDRVTSVYPWYIYDEWLTILTIPPAVVTEIPVWGISLCSDKTDGIITLTSSVQPPPFSHYYPTKTLEGRTTIKGGTTLPQIVITITPNPHPTIVPTTTDSIINPSPKPSWTSGKPPKPTVDPGCPGCGKLGDPDDGDHTESSSSAQTTNIAGTVLFENIYDEAFATGLVATSDLDVIESDVSSFLGLTPPTITTTVVRTTTINYTPTSWVTVTPTPEARCEYWEDTFNYVFRISEIKWWSLDGGSELHKQEKGCGAIADWNCFKNETMGDWVAFDLPFILKAGCVERAIVSAGGPKLSCQDEGDY